MCSHIIYIYACTCSAIKVELADNTFIIHYRWNCLPVDVLVYHRHCHSLRINYEYQIRSGAPNKLALHRRKVVFRRVNTEWLVMQMRVVATMGTRDQPNLCTWPLVTQSITNTERSLRHGPRAFREQTFQNSSAGTNWSLLIAGPQLAHLNYDMHSWTPLVITALLKLMHHLKFRTWSVTSCKHCYVFWTPNWAVVVHPPMQTRQAIAKRDALLVSWIIILGYKLSHKLTLRVST